MEVFDAKTFLKQKEDEIVRKFLTLRKNELIALAQNLQLEIKNAMRKFEIQRVMMNYLVEEEIVSEDKIGIPDVIPIPNVEMEKKNLNYMSQACGWGVVLLAARLLQNKRAEIILTFP